MPTVMTKPTKPRWGMKAVLSLGASVVFFILVAGIGQSFDTTGALTLGTGFYWITVALWVASGTAALLLLGKAWAVAVRQAALPQLATGSLALSFLSLVTLIYMAGIASSEEDSAPEWVSSVSVISSVVLVVSFLAAFVLAAVSLVRFSRDEKK